LFHYDVCRFERCSEHSRVPGVGGVSLVPAQMWDSRSPVLVWMRAGASLAVAQMRGRWQKVGGRPMGGQGRGGDVGGAESLGSRRLGHDMPFLVSRSGSCDVFPGAAVRGVSPILLRTWIGPVPVKMQAALSPVVAKMRAWASPVLAQMWERICPVCDVAMKSRRRCG
jgi:hypothetical protein